MGGVAQRVPSSGRAGYGKLGGRSETQASAHVHGNSTTCQAPRQLSAPVGGLSLHAPRSQDPPPPDEPPSLGPRHTAPGSSGSLHTEQRPSLLYTLSSKHSCTVGVSAAGGGEPPKGKWRWVGSRSSGLAPLPLGTGRGGLSVPCPASARASALHRWRSPQVARLPLAGRGETRDPQSTPIQGFTIHICILKATFPHRHTW